jgi:hypothetical protein
MSRFSEFLTNEKIDPRRLLVASRQIERLRPEDRALRLKKRLGKKSGEAPAAAAADGEKKEAPSKRRSGRTITARLLAAAQSGGALSGAQKTRLLRALNRVLEQKKKDPVDIRKVF